MIQVVEAESNFTFWRSCIIPKIGRKTSVERRTGTEI